MSCHSYEDTLEKERVDDHLLIFSPVLVMAIPKNMDPVVTL